MRLDEDAAPPEPGSSESGQSSLSALNDLKALPLTTVDGRNLQVSFAVDPVLDLRASALAGHRVEARMLDRERGEELTGAERRQLLPRDFGKIDLAAMERGLSRLTGIDPEGPPRLIIQLSFASLSNSRIRTALIEKAGSLQNLLRQAAICELVDVENGIPVTRLQELHALVKPFFRGVWLQIEPRRSLIETAKAARIQGLSVRAGDLGADPGTIARGMRAFMRLVANPAPVLTVNSLTHQELTVEAVSAGFTHATLRST